MGKILKVGGNTGSMEYHKAMGNDILGKDIVQINHFDYIGMPVTGIADDGSGHRRFKEALYDIVQNNKIDITLIGTFNDTRIYNEVIDIIRTSTNNTKIVACIDVFFQDVTPEFLELYKRFDKLLCPNISSKVYLDKYVPEHVETHLFGNPAFCRYVEENDCREEGGERYANRDNILKVLFAEQPMSKYNGKSEFDLYRLILKTIKDHNVEYQMDIKLHPESNKEDWIDFEGTILNINADQLLKKDYIKHYDLVIGHSSTIMIKTELVGIPTIFTLDKTDLEVQNMIGEFIRTRQLTPSEFPHIRHRTNLQILEL